MGGTVKVFAERVVLRERDGILHANTAFPRCPKGRAIHLQSVFVAPEIGPEKPLLPHRADIHDWKKVVDAEEKEFRLNVLEPRGRKVLGITCEQSPAEKALPAGAALAAA